MTRWLLPLLLALTACGGGEAPRLESQQQGIAVPSGFVDATFAAGMSTPTAMAFAPDGRIFICEQRGRLRVVKNGVLLPTPFVALDVDYIGERGLLGVAFAPDFATSRQVYVYYTATSPASHNRVSRFTANGDVAVAGSEVVILELENLTDAINHNGGALHFGTDGLLYVAVGENGYGPNAQSLASRKGKILRIDRNGGIPTSNPFYGTATGVYRSIWAMGLRNPFTFSINPATGRMFINDVGQSAWEEVNEGVAGANYGWPTTEGPTTDPRFRSPLVSYAHGSGATQGCAVTGGAFYLPSVAQFPMAYRGGYFFADYCNGWIRFLNPATGAVSGFLTGAASIVDVQVGPDGALYYLERGFTGNAGRVGRVRYAQQGQAPTITAQPVSVSASIGQSVTFSVTAAGTAPLQYLWQRNGANLGGATASSYTLVAAAADNGAQFRVQVSNAYGGVTSATATLTVTANRVPVATITQPTSGTLYTAGQVLQFAGTGSDPEDGALGAAAFTWWIDFHHDTHLHPFLPPTSNRTGGAIVLPNVGETASNVWYRLHLTVKDSRGATASVQRDLFPRKVQVMLATQPAGLRLTLDGQPVTAPLTFTGVVGLRRTLGAPSPQTVGSVTYRFLGWSDGGAATHTVTTPASNTTYTARFGP